MLKTLKKIKYKHKKNFKCVNVQNIHNTEMQNNRCSNQYSTYQYPASSLRT